MKIKDTLQENGIEVFTRKIARKRGYRLIFTLGLAILMFLSGFYFHKKSIYDDNFMLLIKIAKDNVALIPKMIKGMQSEPEHLIIDIKHKHLQKLAYQREVALASGNLVAGDESYVPASIRYKDDEWVDIKIRLKGDRIDHLRGDKWSFRIRVKGEKTLLGMKQFSLHHPVARNYIDEWIYHQALRREGVIALRYEFVQITLNGKDLGIYALEEHFEKRLIENNRLREGPIVRFNEDLLWDENIRQHNEFPYAMRSGSGHYLSSDIDAFQTGKLMADSASYLQFRKALYLLEGFRRGEIKTSMAFDIQKLSKYFAIADLMGAEHGSRWHNIRFYYNPITALLEPIGFDGNSGKLLESLLATRSGMYINELPSNSYEFFFSMIFADPLFFSEYVQVLERISNPAYLDELFADINKKFEKNLAIIYKEFPHYTFSRDAFRKNQKYIRTVLDPVKGLHAYFRKANKNSMQLELGNIQSMPLEVINAVYGDSIVFAPVEVMALAAKNRSAPVDYQRVEFEFPEGFIWSDTLAQQLEIRYKIAGASRARQEKVFPWPFFDEALVRNDFTRQQPTAGQFDFVRIDPISKQIIIKPGVWSIDKNLILPKGYRVICLEGTTLNLFSSASILSFSPVEFLGSEENPIVIQAPDSTGQGFFVMNAGSASILRYVIFNNLSSPSYNGWALTGAVTLYESPVDILYCQFNKNRSEDGLNIVRSPFTLERSSFSQTFSDAFDGDFVEGKVINTSFYNCGNDAIDVSGSILEVRDVYIKGAGDKGLSAGEDSRMTVAEASIENAEIAVASKDKSYIHIQNIDLKKCKIGFTSYQKKPEFGAASIRVAGLASSDIQIPYLLENRSTLFVDGISIEPSRRNVKEILYGVEYGKSSK